MAKVKIQGHASGTGVITVTAPNTSTDRTITLPDTTGTLLDENSSVPAANLTGTVADARISTLTASKLTGALPAISGASLTGISGGKILQVVNVEAAETGAQDFGDGAAYADINDMSVTITPTASSSKILFMFYCSAHIYGSCDGYVQVLRGSTSIANAGRWSGYNSNAQWTPYPVYVQGVDSPSTTNATTYKLQGKRVGGSYFRFHDHSNGSSNHNTCIAIEIGA
jgi:hypothetical protein